MRKRVIDQRAIDTEGWLDLEKLVTVEISSEDPAHPIDHALTGQDEGWLAAASGEQVVRMLFDEPRAVRLIELQFEERRIGRTQEFLLRWSPDRRSYQDIVRQQFTFSPPGTTSETERFVVNLSGVSAIELVIVPDINHGPARASLRRLRIA